MNSLDDSLRELPDNALVLCLEGGSASGLFTDAGESLDTTCRVWFQAKSAGKSVALLETTLGELGFGSSGVQAGDGHYRLPLYIGRALGELFGPAADLVWLVLTEPRGPLPCVPWEALLSPWVGTPLVRYSSNDFSAQQFAQTRDSVVCFCCAADDSVADRRAVVELYLGMLPEHMGESTIHVFADEATRRLLDHTRPQFSFHDSPERWTFPDASRAGVANPWLGWVLDEMRDKAVNFVHFICDGALGVEEGGLSFIRPVSAADDQKGYPVGAREVNAFLDRLGTWSVGFSSPPTNRSVAGLRYLHEQLGEARSGPVIFHDMNRDFDGTALMAAYRFYVLGGWATRSGAISLYWNPLRARYQMQEKRPLAELTPATRLRQLAAEGDAPGWLSSAQRTFEASLSVLRKEPDSERERQIQHGVAAALQFASQAIAESIETSRQSAAPAPGENADVGN